MRWSKILIPTTKEDPKDAEATSHKLMLRAGMIRKLSAGVYSYLPLGFKVLNKIIAIVREEMNKIGAQEVLLPAIHPAEIWKKTGRYELLSGILMKINEDESNEMVLGPTHEEIITELAAGYISSYKDLPQVLYQIQSKFRDEARPRFGVIRSKEFIMKDAYSFDDSPESLDHNYKSMYEAYKRIYDRCGLSYEIVSADSGDMGGDVSHEFMVKVPFGEDVIVSCSNCERSASMEIAACSEEEMRNEKDEEKPLEEFLTPGIKTIDQLCEKYSLKAENLIKTLIYKTDENYIMCIVRGDCEICEIKLKKVLGANVVTLADEKEVQNVIGAQVGFAGPIGMTDTKIIADYSVRGIRCGVTGANKNDVHYRNVSIDRDVKNLSYADIRYAKTGDVCPKCKQGNVVLARALEIGHVFKLGTKYSKALNCNFTDNQGKSQDVIMGCYGIGVNRILAASIELNSDEKGIKWPNELAPYKVAIITVNQSQDESVTFADKLYEELKKKGIEVLYDDRDVRAGVKFNDVELIGVPIVIVVGERNMKNKQVELKKRSDGSSALISIDDIKAEVEKNIG